MQRIAMFAALVLVPPLLALSRETDCRLEIGGAFPDMAFEQLLSPQDYEALGLPRREGAVRLSDVPGDLLILEFFNKYCLTCWRMAPQLETFSELLVPGDLAGRVRILAVGAGNNPDELGEFRREFELTYPLAADPSFDRFYRLGDKASAPCTAFLLRRDDRWVLADFHVGFYGDVELLARSRVLLKGWTQPPGTTLVTIQTSWAQESLASKARGLLAQVAGAEVSVEVLEMADGNRLFRALRGDGSSLGLFARASKREPVCDLCHTIFFLFSFDDEGAVRGFEPIFVTKFGNELWSAEDTERFKERLLARKIYDLRFDPDVDAVTSATMSSALIFDEIRRSSSYLKELH